MNIFLTGSGSLATELVKQLSPRKEVAKIVIYSRDEGKHAKLRKSFPEGPPSKLRYRIGDIRDLPRLTEAMQDCTHVIHTAAMKRIDDCANHVQECVHTNVIGSKNVIQACHANDIDRCLLISTDKACSPISAYGASKLMAEHLFIHANSKLNTMFAVARYGNVIGSRGSVFHKWRELSENTVKVEEHIPGVGDRGTIRLQDIPVTSKYMTRFFWSVSEAANFALDCLYTMRRGMIYIPKMKSYRMWDIARCYGNPVETELRTAEKIHEAMVSPDEAPYLYEAGKAMAIYPEHHQWAADIETLGKHIGKPYTSDEHLSEWEGM